MLVDESKEQGSIAICHLKRFWRKYHAFRNQKIALPASEKRLDAALLDSLGLGLEPTMMYLLGQNPSFEQFEAWILEHTNLEKQGQYIARFNALFEVVFNEADDEIENVLSKEELQFFDENGYLIIRDAISPEARKETVQLICDTLNVDLDDPKSWYQLNEEKQGIMVQLFNHWLLDQNRRSPKIRKVYEQLWQTKRLWVSTDRVGFNPPETKDWKFPGPHLHLDLEPFYPLPFGLQGILYLTDVAANQGAFTVVPGFHHKINEWMTQFPNGQVPLSGVFNSFATRPIAANAGDFIVWHHGLPHGSSPNRAATPRIVQYINYYPV